MLDPATVDRTAAAVLGRTAAWIVRQPAQARYVEATLSPWAARLADPEIQALVTGFDAESPEVRATRATRLLELLAPVGAEEPRPTEVRGVLLPDGVAREVPPPPPPQPVAPVAEAPVVVEPVRAREERVREDRPREDRPREERPERPREDRAREDRPREERSRDERPRDRREDRSRDRRDERPRNERARDERTRDDRPRDDRREDRVREEAPRDERARDDAPPERPKVEEPPPPPPTFPLAHPSATGQPVEKLGVFTPAEVELLAGEGIETIADLLLQPPTEISRAGERVVDGVPPDGPVLVRGRVLGRYTRLRPYARITELRLQTDRGVMPCRWLGAPPVEVLAARVGSDLGLVGRLDGDDEASRILYEAEPLGVDGRGGDWLPRYGLAGVDDSRVRAAIRKALRDHEGSLQDHLPPEVIERARLIALPTALRDVHFPSNASRRGRARLAFDELLQIQLGLALLRTRPGRERGVGHTVAHTLVTQAFSTLGWYFNDAQEAAFDAIRRDMRRNQPMERLLLGDTGSGKMAVARAAMLVAAEGRLQTFFIAPDATTAETHWLFSSEWFKAAGIEPLLLTGAPTRTQAEALRKGETLVVIGTPALLKQPPETRRVGLVVVEQPTHHGVPDLAAFDAQGARPDLLVVTPTPVPALLTLTAYGQLAMTVVGPTAGHGVDVDVLADGNREPAYAAAREAITRGEQVILAFPMLRGQDLMSPWEARRLGETLLADIPGLRIALFNGGISREERFRAYDDFQHRRADLLLATTTFEDGPIVPNASVLIVEQADKLDLVRMHRLRRHIANGYRRGRCFFVPGEDRAPEGMAALDLILKESDGFRIADLDLATRGAAAVLGEGSDDVPRFAWADPAHDRDTLGRARTEAFRLLALDPGLKRRVHRALVNLVRARFGEELLTEGGAPAVVPDAGQGRGRRRRRRR